MAFPESHQNIDRETTQVKTENLYGDRLVNYIVRIQGARAAAVTC
jgi:hypothetical protein